MTGISTLFNSKGFAQDTNYEKHIEVSLRMIGHELLLSSGDSVSRVLPILREKNQYRIQFESEFEFNPDDLVNIVNRIFEDVKMANGYFMEAEQCDTRAVVYSYEMGNLKTGDVIPCRSRNLPKSCYSLLFTLNATENKIDPHTPPHSNNLMAKTRKINSITIIITILLIGSLIFFLWKMKKVNVSDPNLIVLGKFHFNTRKSELIIEKQIIELTSKEADLLLLLYNALNSTVEREVILNMVWGDEGDYVGRTLDVFISKLRKKLEADSSVKIVNIRGVGYKLIMD